jgi:hypothetical protein
MRFQFEKSRCLGDDGLFRLRRIQLLEHLHMECDPLGARWVYLPAPLCLEHNPPAIRPSLEKQGEHIAKLALKRRIASQQARERGPLLLFAVALKTHLQCAESLACIVKGGRATFFSVDKSATAATRFGTGFVIAITARGRS